MRGLLGRVSALVVVSAGAIVFTQQQPAVRCDRACLNALVDTYLAAVVAHNPSLVKLAPGAKLVENLSPTDLPAAHIYKVSGGKIHEIEAMGFVTAYNSKTGWE